MSEFLANIGYLAGQNRFLAYFIVYIATIFLGNVAAFAGLWMAFRGIFGFWGVPILVAVILLAETNGDLLWYALGKTLRDTRFGNFIKNHLPRHGKIERSVRKNGKRWVFMSKFIYTASFPIVFMVGWVGVEFKTFIRTSLIGISIWAPIISLLAYGLVSGLSPLHAVSDFKQLEYIFLVGIVVFIVIDIILSKIFQFVFKKIWADADGNGDNGEE
jgi:membrane protein DedA with SNARE-associated domain